MRDSSLLDWARRNRPGNVTPLRPPPVENFREDEPTEPMRPLGPQPFEVRAEDLPLPNIPLPKPLMHEIAGMEVVYSVLAGLSHEGRERLLKIVILWLGEFSPDPRDRELARKAAEPLVAPEEEAQADG